MRSILPLPVMLPLLGAALCIVFGRSRRVQRTIGLTVLTANVVIAVIILVNVDQHGTVVTFMGGWPAPVGITLVADRLSAIMLTIGAVMLLAVLMYAIGQPGAERNHVGFQSVYLVLAAGVSGAFLTGDLFNLFVSFEMMLTASYVLITLGGTRDQVRSGMTYVVISLLASVLFVAALALLYAATGTVNMADLAEKIHELPEGLRLGFALLLLVVFGIKAALFPLFFWLPDSYPTAPAPVTAVFAGLLTKVGVYAVIRTQTLFFQPSTNVGTVLLIVAGFTMIVGVLGAIAQGDMKRILSFHIVSHVGNMVMGLALFTVAGIAGSIFYTAHHIVVMTTLFLTGGLVEHAAGTSQLSKMNGLLKRAPVIAILFLVAALSLAGIPPFSGFVAKFALVRAGVDASAYWIVGISLVVGLLTLFSMMKIWSGAFWTRAEGPPVESVRRVGRLGGPALMVVPTAALATITLAVALAAGPIYAFSERTAAELLTPSAYVDAVLRP